MQRRNCPAMVGVLGGLLLCASAHAAWIEKEWAYRRPVDVESASGTDELAFADIYTGGSHKASGESIRVAGEDGRLVPARVLMIGPGDRMRLVFTPAKGVKKYFVYFGHPKPPAAPKGMDDPPIRGGLLLEMHKFSGPLSGNFKQVEAAWGRSKSLIGRTMVPRLFLGYNPLGDEVQIIARYSGSLYAPSDGEYTFAGAASDRGALYIDGKPLLWIPAAPGNTRFNAKIDLNRGRHDILLYQENIAGEQRLSVAWKTPGSSRFEVIAPAAFGTLIKASCGPIEQYARPAQADMKIEYAGECFYSEHYSHRYKFSVVRPRELESAAARYEWDFGDGQTAQGLSVDHVFLADGEYPVTLTTRLGRTTNTRTNRLAVSRLYEQLDKPPFDLPSAQAKLVAAYDVAKMPARSVPWAVLLFVRSKEAGPLEKSAVRLAGLGAAVETGLATSILKSAAEELSSQGQFDAAARVYEAVPAGSAYQPFIVKDYANLLLWRLADFPKALKVLEGYIKSNPADYPAKRMHAQALILNQRAAEGAKVLTSMLAEGLPERQGAVAGALARTIEFYITQGDWEAGEESWEQWQQQYPADFLEGYSVMLQTKLMEKAKAPVAAAKVAEAFAMAVPRSSYAPQLLDRASKLLERSDPAKSRSLRQLLKQKYPEDPLSQEK